MRSGPVNLEEVERGDRGVENDKPGQTAPSMDPGQAGMLLLSRGAGSEVQIPPPSPRMFQKKTKIKNKSEAIPPAPIWRAHLIGKHNTFIAFLMKNH